jgi:hypothetical protein
VDESVEEFFKFIAGNGGRCVGVGRHGGRRQVSLLWVERRAGSGLRQKGIFWRTGTRCFVGIGLRLRSASRGKENCPR